MRICYVSYEYPPQYGGGIGTYVHNIAVHLSRRGHQITIITFNPGDLPAYEEQGGICIYRITLDQGDHDAISQALPEAHPLVYWQRYSDKVYNLLKIIQHTIDVVEWPDYRLEGLASFKAKRTKGHFSGIPFVVRLHTPNFVLNKYNEQPDSAENKLTVKYEKLALEMADYICSPSKILARIVKKEIDWPDEITILPHPLDFDLFPSVPSYKDSPTILYVGRLERRKGVETLIRAIIPLLEKHPEISLKLIGGDTYTGPGATSMRAYLEGLIPPAIIDRINFLGNMPRESLLNEYRNVRCCVFPSLFENFPNVCLEAMASGAPVIVGHNSGMTEMVQHNRTGLVFESGNVLDLQNKLKQMLTLPLEQRRRMAEEAHRWVRNKFGVEKTVGEQEDYFIKITGRIKGGEKSTGHTVSLADKNTYQPGLVSVVIPCLTQCDFLPETLENLKDQAYDKYEIIIAHGNTAVSTPGAEGIKVIRGSEQTLSVLYNAGLDHAVGEYILTLLPGQFPAPDFLTLTTRVLQEEPNVGFVYTWSDVGGFIWESPEYSPGLLLSMNLCRGPCLFRRDAFSRVGGFEETADGLEVWSFLITLAELGWKGKCIQQPLARCSSDPLHYMQFPTAELIKRHMDFYRNNLHHVIFDMTSCFQRAYTGQQQELAGLNLELQQLNQELVRANEVNKNLELELQLIYNSKAWQWVTRYRKVKDIIRRG